ncbi:MAG: flagellar basal body rod protein FlgF [Pseudomonadota bacterium]
MDRFLYVGMNGARQLMMAQAVNANNLANASTTGFRADLHGFEAKEGQGVGFHSRINPSATSQSIDLSYGAIRETGRRLDVALSGDGFFVVQDPSGAEGLTRNGEFSIGPGGLLSTSNGGLVLGEGGPISIPPGGQPFIEPDGSVLVSQDGGAGAAVGRLRLVNPPAQSLYRREDGLLNASEPFEDDPEVRVRSGALEQSNVNPVHEMVRMIELSRLWEMNVKTMTAAEENARAAASVATFVR